MFKLIPNYSLRDHNGFRLDVRTCYWLSLSSAAEWPQALERYPHISDEPILIIGAGTNLLFLSDYNGLVISPDFGGIRLLGHQGGKLFVEAGAGVPWDEFVSYCVENGWYGLENLSLIPGTTGAAAVQNIGAYGSEVAGIIHEVNWLDLNSKETGTFSNDECAFGYRTSRWKTEPEMNRMVTSVVFALDENGIPDTSYGDLARQVAAFGEPTPANIREAVIALRRQKLPDPAKTGNAGSFFKNPIVRASKGARLAESLPGLPVYPLPDGNCKLAAGFLIEQAGWKGKTLGRAAVHENQALVLVNKGGATGEEILALSEAIRADVAEKYGVELEREVQVVG